MSRIGNSICALVTALACAGVLASSSAQAAPAQTVPLTFTQQGRLLDDAGEPIDGGALVFKFALYASATGGTELWSEEQSITPDQGYFSARIGETTAFPSTLFDGSKGTLFLGVTVGSDSEMTPRQQLTSTPFSLLSLNAVHATSADSASEATGGLNTRINALETRDSCPDPTARAKWGFCIWLEDPGTPGYNTNYRGAATACKDKGARLCTLAEVSAAQAAGAEWCSWGWVADRTNDTTAYVAFPMQVTAVGCGNAGVVTGTPAMTAQYNANCCKP